MFIPLRSRSSFYNILNVREVFEILKNESSFNMWRYLVHPMARKKVFFLIEKLFRAGHTRRPYHKILSSMKIITKLNVEGYRFFFGDCGIRFGIISKITLTSKRRRVANNPSVGVLSHTKTKNHKKKKALIFIQ